MLGSGPIKSQNRRRWAASEARLDRKDPETGSSEAAVDDVSEAASQRTGICFGAYELAHFSYPMIVGCKSTKLVSQPGRGCVLLIPWRASIGAINWIGFGRSSTPWVRPEVGSTDARNAHDDYCFGDSDLGGKLTNVTLS